MSILTFRYAAFSKIFLNTTLSRAHKIPSDAATIVAALWKEKNQKLH